MPQKQQREFGGLTFTFAATAAAATTIVTVKNNRQVPFVVTDVGCMATQAAGGNSHMKWAVQVRDQSTQREWFSAAVSLSSWLGAGVPSGVLDADEGAAPQVPFKLPAPYVVAPGAQIMMSATNNGTNSAGLDITLMGFYTNAEV